MTLVSLKSGTENGAEFVRIVLSDDSSLSLKVCYLSEICKNPVLWDAGKEISSAEEEELRFAAVCSRAEQAGLRLIARAEQTEMGLFRKLEKRGHDSDGAAAVVSRFVSMGLINDERYAELWIRSALAGGKASSPRKLSASLRNRGINSSTVGKALKNSLDAEAELFLLRRYIEKYQSNLEKQPNPRSFLKFEGFSPGVLSIYFED
jgi:regulatory protein